jgi:hypothetical protein
MRGFLTFILVAIFLGVIFRGASEITINILSGFLIFWAIWIAQRKIRETIKNSKKLDEYLEEK